MKTSKDFENDLRQKVFDNYGKGYFLKKIPKLNLSLYKINGDLIAIKKMYINSINLVKNNDIINHLYDNDYYNVEKVIPTIEGELCITVNDDMYVAFSYIDNEKLDFSDIGNIKIALEGLKKLHKKLENYSVDKSEENEVYNLDKYISKLDKVKKTVSAQKKKSDFDFMFLKTYNSVRKQATMYISELNINDSYKSSNLQIICNTVNINYKGNDIVINGNLTFDYGYIYADIFNILYKYLKKSETQDIKDFDTIISYYDTNLTEQQKDIIKIYLQFPFKYIDTMVQYYVKKRIFVPSSIFTDLDEIQEIEKKIQYFIK